MHYSLLSKTHKVTFIKDVLTIKQLHVKTLKNKQAHPTKCEKDHDFALQYISYSCRADNAAYPHNGHADKRRYRHNCQSDSQCPSVLEWVT